MSKTHMSLCTEERKKAVCVLRMEKEIPLIQLFKKVYSQKKKKSILSFVLFQPLKNCHSEQQTEVISLIVQQVIVTELTKGLLICV